MAQHGYLHDSYDNGDFGRNEERSWRDRDDESSWRSRDREESNRWRNSDDYRDAGDRGSMFGGWRDQDRYSNDRNRDDGRGFFDRTKDEAREWFGGNDRDHDRARGRYGSDRDDWQGSTQSGSWSQSQGGSGRGQREGSAFGSNQGDRRYSAHPDDHYRSWRDKQMQALDRDYQDYCREREQQFHSDFDSWRQNRQGQNSTSQPQASASNESLELNQVASGGEIEGATPSPMGAATMGTNNSENDTLVPGSSGRTRR